MKISPISNNFNKKACKPAFGTVYLNEVFGLDPEPRQKLKARIEKLEKKYPGTDIYLESERESNALFSGIFIITEKGQNGPLKKVEQPLERQKGLFELFLDRICSSPPEMESELDPNLFAVRTAINGRTMDIFMDASNNNKGGSKAELKNELVIERVYEFVEECYKRYANLRTIASEIETSHPGIPRQKLIEMSRELEDMDSRKKPRDLVYKIQDWECQD